MPPICPDKYSPMEKLYVIPQLAMPSEQHSVAIFYNRKPLRTRNQGSLQEMHIGDKATAAGRVPFR